MLHVFAIVVWLGGLMFQNTVAFPVANAGGDEAMRSYGKMSKRFVGFIWMSVWTLGITGLLLMLFNPQFVWFHYDDTWSKFLGFKQIIFILMFIYAVGYARMLAYLQAPASNGGFDEKADMYAKRVRQYRTISIFLGIIGLLLAAGMHG